MKFVKLAQCKMDLRFASRERLPRSAPPLAWGGYLISGFSSSQTEAVEIEGSLSQILRDVYAPFSWPELARLCQCLMACGFIKERRALVDSLELRWPESLDRLLERVVKSPDNFQKWLEEKDPGQRELLPLVAVEEEDLSRVFEALRTFDPQTLSRSLGSQILELVSELVGVKKSLSAIEKGHLETFDSWALRLRSLRNPLTSAKDQARALNLKNIAWPLETQGRWIRRGDEGLLEIQLTVTNQHDYKKKISKLLELHAEIENQLWVPR